jgi:hypothetical protein
MTIEQFESLSLAIGIPGLILYMLFIIYKLGAESKAGRFGYFVLFFALGLGMFGFVAKEVIVEVLQL